MLSKIEDIIEDFKNGKMVIMVDDESRENEGDFIISASKVKPEDINFMMKEGRGLICIPIASEIAIPRLPVESGLSESIFFPTFV